jgi:two-component system chemotaxis response regulator CheY
MRLMGINQTKILLNTYKEWEKMAVDMSLSILIVDDYKTMLRIIRNLLKQLGFHNVDEATDGAEALNKLRDKNYDLVISDWNMEPMTGYELLKEVRSDDMLKSLPFIMVTAESKTDNVIAAKKAGVNNYIVKPFNAATLKAKLTSVLTKPESSASFIYCEGKITCPLSSRTLE